MDIASADQEAAIAAYGAAALKAFEEVEAALTNETLLQRREQFLASAVHDNLQAYELAKVQYDVGQTSLLSVSIQEARWIGSRVSLLNVRNLRLAERISLHLALGGSFN